MAYSGEGFTLFGTDVLGNAIAIEATEIGSTRRGSFSISSPFGFKVNSFTAPGSGETVSIASGVKSYSIMVKGVAVEANNWNVVLEGSLNGVDFTTILIHKKSTGNGVLLATETVLIPSLFFRSRVTALNLGAATSINVTILGMD
jgi:hypothetical protein